MAGLEGNRVQHKVTTRWKVGKVEVNGSRIWGFGTSLLLGTLECRNGQEVGNYVPGE